MDTKSFDLKVRPMTQVVNEAVRYIEARKDHKIVSLKTRWNKFNNQCMGGIEPNTIYTITGISGSGKSSWLNLVQTDLIDLNPKQDIIVLAFSLEMVGFRQVGRTLSNKLRKTTSALYSAYERLDDTTFNKVIDVTNQLKDYPIYYVDDPGSPAQVGATIRKFYETYVKGTGKYFIITYDHTLLTRQTGTTIETLTDLQREFISIKKLPLTSIIQLSQMNREIESPERRNNPSSHYPMRSDLSSSDAIYQASDYVIVLHRPEQLNIHEYGPNRLPTANKIYMHILKNRDAGRPCILEFENDLAYNNIIEAQTTSTNN